jgi:ribosomal protein L13
MLEFCRKFSKNYLKKPLKKMLPKGDPGGFCLKKLKFHSFKFLNFK